MLENLAQYYSNLVLASLDGVEEEPLPGGSRRRPLAGQAQSRAALASSRAQTRCCWPQPGGVRVLLRRGRAGGSEVTAWTTSQLVSRRFCGG